MGSVGNDRPRWINNHILGDRGIALGERFQGSGLRRYYTKYREWGRCNDVKDDLYLEGIPGFIPSWRCMVRTMIKGNVDLLLLYPRTVKKVRSYMGQKSWKKFTGKFRNSIVQSPCRSGRSKKCQSSTYDCPIGGDHLRSSQGQKPTRSAISRPFKCWICQFCA